MTTPSNLVSPSIPHENADLRRIRELAQDLGFEDEVLGVLIDRRFHLVSGSHTPEAHHYGDHGLVRHTREVAMTAVQMAEYYNTTGFHDIDLRILFTAAVWHDYGKCWDYELRGPSGVVTWRPTQHRRRIHHISRSAIEWEKYALSAKFPCDFIQDVTHCILSHHGKREWGSPVGPATKEAWILHLCDTMSARVDDCCRLDLFSTKDR